MTRFFAAERMAGGGDSRAITTTCALLVCFLGASGCTPIGARKQAGESADPQQQAQSAGAAGKTLSETSVMTGVVKPDPDSACETVGERSCAPGNPSRQPLVCEDGMWRAKGLCNEGQRCDPAPGGSQGTCVKLARECIGRVPDEEFCDEKGIRVCSDGVSSIIRRCAMNERCIEQANSSPDCGCATGAVELNGACEVAMSCNVENGGCDPLTVCSMGNGGRECGACPPGYMGDGTSLGCSPVLIDLKFSYGATSPQFLPTELNYQVQLPLLRQDVTVTAIVDERVEIEINGEKYKSGVAWNTGTLNLGDQSFALNLKGPNGLTTSYAIAINRGGAEEAYLKPRYSDENDAFGFQIDLEGDTLVVSAPGEDGSSPGLNGDESSNSTIESGAVFVFERVGSEWHQTAYLKADVPGQRDYFGGVLLSGNTLIVGATRQIPYEVPLQARGGHVFVYERSGQQWTKVQEIESPGVQDLFGVALAMNEDVLFIGAPFDAEYGDRSGAFYTVDRKAGWTNLTRHVSPEPKRGASFGWGFALHGDALVVGAPDHSSSTRGVGSAYAYKVAGTSLTHLHALAVPALVDQAGFGYSLSMHGERLAVSAPGPGVPHADPSSRIPTPSGKVYLFERSADRWRQTNELQAIVPRASDYFGVKLALSGNTLAIGASGDSVNSTGFGADPNRGTSELYGAFYLFTLTNVGMQPPTYIKGSRMTAGGLMGDFIDISGDTIAVSATRDAGGAVFIFR